MKSMLFGVLPILFLNSVWAQTPQLKPIADALSEVVAGSEYQATESEIRAIELNFAARDLVLEPFLEVNASRANEYRELLFRSAGFKPRIDSVNAILTKPFSTGTTISVGPSWEYALTPSQSPSHRATVDWQVAISQSLWRDGFGRSTELRHSREEFERRRDLANALIRRGQMLFEFETLYWDWALSMRSLELQDKNVKRSQEILRWVQDRFNRSAAESTDLLQAKALLTQSQLRVSTLRQNLTQVGALIERYLPNRQWQPNPADLAAPRPVDQLVTDWRADTLAQVSTLNFLSAANEASAAAQRAKEEREAIRPELNLEAAYGKNAVDPESEDAFRRAWDEKHEYSMVGVVFRTGLGLGTERKKVEAARASQQAAEQRRDARTGENRVAWDQFKRELADLQIQTAQAQELVDLQLRKANAERDRYRKGRSTAFQAITFEQEASEAELTLLNLFAMTRKTEARARLFAR